MKSLATDPMRIYSNIWQGCYIYMRFGEFTIAKHERQKAIDWLKEAAIKWSTFLGCHILLASVCGSIGETGKASEEKEKILWPSISETRPLQ